MAFIYEKADPKSGEKRWMGRIKIGSNRVTVSLRLKANGTKRIAQQRVDHLQREADAGLLSMPTAEWLGEATTLKINMLISRRALLVVGETATSWESAGLGYLKSCEAKDTKTPIAGTARTVERTKRQRRQVVSQMTKWLTDSKVPFLKQPFTKTLIEYIEYRKSRGDVPVTLWASHYTYGVLLGDYLHRRGLCEKPERDLIREFIPPKGTPKVIIPSPDLDVATIRFFQGVRHRFEMREELGVDGDRGRVGVNHRKLKRYMAAWSLLLCIRGLGCRPSEASALAWETVAPDLKTAHLLSTKTGMVREVPVLFEWVRAGLEELREIHKGVGPVCRSTTNQAWGDDSGIYYCWRQILAGHDMPPYHLKKSQKCFIAQTIKMGFPPHVVANWTGHTLTVQEKHYCESKSYLPSRTEDDYGEYGILSEWGSQVRSHLASFANLIPNR